MSKQKENIKLVPKLRFPEFVEDGEWENTKLGKYLLRHPEYGIGAAAVPYSKILPTYLRITDISEDGKFIKNRKISVAEDVNEVNYLTEGDIVFARTGASVGKSYKYRVEDGKLVFAGFLIRVKPDEVKLNSEFLFQFISTEQYWRWVKFASARSGQPGINGKQYASMPILLPQSPKEQQKIANCLFTLDSIITVETEKLDLLKDHKKGLLQQLFPTNGETVPKRRFPEFVEDEEWEETTLDDVANYENGKAHEKEISENGKYKVVNSKFISTDGEIVKYTNSANLKASIGDILMVLSDVPNGKAIAKCFFVDKNDTYTVNQRICKITPTNADNKFLFYILNRNAYFLSFDDGVKQTNLRKDDVLNFPLLKPTNIKEQQKIANTFTAVDELITVQTEKIEALKQHKKGLMQGLFPKTNN